MSLELNLLLLLLVLGAALWMILTPTLLKSAIGLAITSAVLALVLFHMGAPWAGVFELSVCAGLITVVFVSVISMVHPLTPEQAQTQEKAHDQRYRTLPWLLILVSLLAPSFALFLYRDLPIIPAPPPTDVRQMLWELRRFDLTGQMLIILAGAFGVVVLFKGLHPEDRK